MRFAEINEARGESKIMYHGTSSTFLPQIMKHGLVPNPEQKVYDEGELESYSGVYLTSNKNDAQRAATFAVEKFYGDEVVVLVQALMKSTETDEDMIGQLWSSAIYAASHSWAPGQISNVKTSHKNKIKILFKRFIDHMVTDKKIKLNHKAVEIIKDMEEYMKLNTDIGSFYRPYRRTDWRWRRNLGLTFRALEELTKTHSELKRMVDLLSQNIVYKSAKPRRVLQPIKFRGKTRIVKIVMGVKGYSRKSSSDTHWVEIWPENERKKRDY